MDVNTTSTVSPDIYNYINDYLVNSNSYIIVVVIILIFLILFLSLGDSSQNNTTTYSGTSDSDDTGTNIIYTIIIVIFIILLLINGLFYFFSIDVVATIKKMFTNEPEIDIAINNLKLDYIQEPKIFKEQRQVFNIPGNEYSYDDAKSVCKVYDARLATYDEVENSYGSGGEWCNYGWSQDQLALFPTQKKTYNELQKIKGHENDCGRPGVNGGYIANPEVKFGVNCFGYKPKITSEEEEMMQNISPYPKTQKDIEMETKVDYWKTKINDILISPFNHTKWSRV